jgi:D-alanyl-D-alanine carboxypeptidase (penicillin-binding protein 5/6)
VKGVDSNLDSVITADQKPLRSLRVYPRMALLRRWWLVLGVLGIGAFYVWIVPPGLPYDEPSHWATVLYYANHARLPVLGDPGVTYEAEQGPVAYVIDAVADRAVRGLGFSTNVAFRVVRLIGLLELLIAAVLIAALVRRTVPSAVAAAAAVALVALNPMLLTMSGSVQNDALALALGSLTLYLALTRLDTRPTIRAAVGIGVVAGLAVLTKLSAIAVVPAIAVWLVWRHRRAALRPLAAFLGAMIVTSGWWFVRNAVLYGDLTGAKAVSRTGVTFGVYHVHSLGAVGHIVEEVVTYLWLPTEYLRNTISAGVVLKAGVVLLTAGLAGAGVVYLRKRGAQVLLALCAVVSVIGWLVTNSFYEAAAPRVAYMALPFWAVLLACALSRLRATVALALSALVLGALNVWALYEIQRVPSPPSPLGERAALRQGGVSAGRVEVAPVRTAWRASAPE